MIFYFMTKLESLLEAGVHFGHQVGRWNSKMAPYIYETKNGVHILDLVQTLNDLEKANVCFKSFEKRFIRWNTYTDCSHYRNNSPRNVMGTT